MIEKSLYYLLLHTIPNVFVLHEYSIRWEMTWSSLFHCKIFKCCQMVRTAPVSSCLLKSCTVPFGGNFSLVFPRKCRESAPGLLPKNITFRKGNQCWISKKFSPRIRVFREAPFFVLRPRRLRGTIGSEDENEHDLKADSRHTKFLILLRHYKAITEMFFTESRILWPCLSNRYGELIMMIGLR